MSTSSALYAALIASSDVSALVGTRVYAVSPRGVPSSPYVIYQQIAADPGSTHEGASGATERMYQIACFARTYEESVALRDAVVSALDGVVLSNGDSPTLEDERDGEFDDAAVLHRADADFLI